MDPTAGCELDASCPRITQQQLCEETGGSWMMGGPSCGHYYCGHPNMVDPCVAPGCDCGPLSNFDDLEGCQPDADCLMSEEGQQCRGVGWDSNCRPGLVCCSIHHLLWDPTCMAPCCEEWGEVCMDNGCMVPPP